MVSGCEFLKSEEKKKEKNGADVISQEPVPATPIEQRCEFKTDYNPGFKCSNKIFVAKNQEDLDRYLTDYGLEKKRYKRLKIDFNPRGDDIQVHSPCSIIFAPKVVVTGENVCFDGREGVIDNSAEFKINSYHTGIISEKGDVILGSKSRIKGYSV